MVRLIQRHFEVKLSLDVFQTYSSKNIIPYSAFVCPILKTKLALFRDTDQKRIPQKSPQRRFAPEVGPMEAYGGLQGVYGSLR